jgi:hypothetical protein
VPTFVASSMVATSRSPCQDPSLPGPAGLFDPRIPR